MAPTSSRNKPLHSMPISLYPSMAITIWGAAHAAYPCAIGARRHRRCSPAFPTRPSPSRSRLISPNPTAHSTMTTLPAVLDGEEDAGLVCGRLVARQCDHGKWLRWRAHRQGPGPGLICHTHVPPHRSRSSRPFRMPAATSRWVGMAGLVGLAPLVASRRCAMAPALRSAIAFRGWWKGVVGATRIGGCLPAELALLPISSGQMDLFAPASRAHTSRRAPLSGRGAPGRRAC